MQDMRKNNFSIENINNTETWLFRIRAIDYSSLQTVIKFCDGFCHYVHSRCIDENNRSKKIINDLKNHPLTSKGLILKDAPGAIILIKGDNDLKFIEIEEIMNFLKDEFSDNAWINFGIHQ